MKFAAEQISFYVSSNGNDIGLPALAEDTVKKLGRIGAYTHELGRYWCYRLLKEQPLLLRAMARRYPHIVIDEAQDIGSVHQAILELLISAGISVSLIGDVNQSIYEFAGADGSFLRDYSSREGVETCVISKNRRSIPKIVAVASSLSGREDTAERIPKRESHGAYFLGYGKGEEAKLIEAFQLAIAKEELDVSRSAVVCRGAPLAEKLAGKKTGIGKGATARMIVASLRRDRDGDYGAAFEAMAGALVMLLDDPPQNFVSQIMDSSRHSGIVELRRLIWQFVRNSETGLPSAALKGAAEWHPLALARVKNLVQIVERDFGLKPADKLGNKITKTGLTDEPLLPPSDLAEEGSPKTVIRIDTVHKVKGESLDALLYITTNAHVEGLLAGTGEEIGRIGYVAATRAQDLFWLGVPAKNLDDLRPKLLAHGFQEVGRG
ncbi:MAG: ATP-dependent helicase [Proteobacteria bacterium]|nr:ATP-dependent helicase [Pseudomonadota bacterium]